MYINTNLYNPNRQFNFILRQLSLFRQGWLIAAAAVFGLLLVISIAKAWFVPHDVSSLRGMYTGVLFFGGLIFTSQMFQELHTPNRSYAYLTLPVSTLEKLTGAWLLSSPLYILAYTAVTFIIYLISTAVAGFPVAPFNFFSFQYWDTIAGYMVVQTIFLWGACYFRKNNFLKTILVLMVVPTLLGIVAWLLFLILFDISSFKNNNTNIEFDQITGDWIGNTLKFLWYGVFGPYMLLTTYFTLKERQV